MQNKILMGIATMLLARSKKLRWIAPILPLAITAYQAYKAHQAQQPRMQPA